MLLWVPNQALHQLEDGIWRAESAISCDLQLAVSVATPLSKTIMTNRVLHD